MIFFLICFVSFALCGAFDRLETFFTQTVGELTRDICPFVGIGGSKYCPDKSYHWQDFCLSEEDGGEVFSGELITYDPVTKTSGYPIIDFEQSNGLEEDHGSNMIAKYYPLIFSTVDEFFDNYLSFDMTGKPFRNGMFSSVKDMVDFFEQNFGNGKNAYFSVNQKEYITKTKSIPDNSKIVFKDQVKEIINTYLPNEYDEQKYAKFVEVFGAYVATSCNFGGLIELQMFVKSCLNETISQAEIEAGMKGDLDNFINNPTNFQRTGNTQYIHKTQIAYEAVYGGNPELEEKTEWKDRIATFPQDPVATSCTFVAISDIISQTLSSQKGENLAAYVKTYLQQPIEERQKEEQICEQKKQEAWENAPQPVVLVSENDFRYYPTTLYKGQTSPTYTFHYGGDSHSFACYCDHGKYCSCGEGNVLASKAVVKGRTDIGNIAYTWTTCHHCGRCLWLGCCCHDHHEIDSVTYGLIDCEMVTKVNGKIQCTCNDF